ncbi:MAG: helix-turn-helix domain-containing protein [Actinomycetota bacterium]|jgi:excisionase family DNA binding protein
MTMPSSPDELLLTASQVAALFGVGRKTINRWTDEGRIPTAATTDGGHRRYRLDDLTPILAAATIQTRRYPPAPRTDGQYRTDTRPATA